MSAPIQRSHVHCESHWKLYTLPFFKAQTGVNRPKSPFQKWGKVISTEFNALLFSFLMLLRYKKGKR